MRLQFEVHLSGRALRMYESLKEDQKQTYTTARDSLTKVLQPVRLDSYRRSQFNSRRQKEEETVGDFAEALQRLMTQAYAKHAMDNELRDKILLGQFEQGLLPKWKKNLKYPLETFEDGVSQARMAEAVDQQLLGEPAKGNAKGKTPKQGAPATSGSTTAGIEHEDGTAAKSASGSQNRKSWIRCYNCQKKGHYASECPNLRTSQQGDTPSTGTTRQRHGYSTNQVSVVQPTADSQSLEGKIDEAKRTCKELQLQRLQLLAHATSNGEARVTVVSEAVGSRPFATVKLEGCLC